MAAPASIRGGHNTRFTQTQRRMSKKMKRSSNARSLAVGARLAATAALVMVAVAAGFLGSTDDIASAATVTVNVGERDGRPGDSGDEFNANTVAITEGDTVQWDWFDGTHNVVPYDPADFTGTGITHFNSSGDTYAVTLNSAGAIYYYCTLHAETRDIEKQFA